MLSVASLQGAPTQQSINPDRKVVIVVWDGMRPDFITARNTPTLWKLGQQGVTFRRHHSVYPTATDVNGAAIATGMYPAHNGLVTNREYRPAIDPKQAFENAEPDVIKKGDSATGGNYLALPTIAEIVRRAGGNAAIVGTKAVAILNDRHAEWSSGATKNSITRFAAAPMPPKAREESLGLLGPFLTDQTSSSEHRNAYATRALTEILWREHVPEFSLLWLSDPDQTQHEYSPGAPPSMAAIKSSDGNLSKVLEALEKKKVRDKTDVLVVSDHGFSTIERGIDFPAVLRAAGFDAVTTFQDTPRAAQIMVVENGGTISFYVIDHDQVVVGRLVDWLQQSEHTGVVFAREKFEGTFPLESAWLNTPDAPDLIVALRWKNVRNRFGIAGQIVTDATRKSGQGSHASLSEFDVHNILIVAGPQFRRGVESDLPSGNIDLAPTVLNLLGIDAPHKFDGRILSEGILKSSAPQQTVTETRQASRNFPEGEWHQHLKISRVGETTYIDEGNGEFHAR